jgi:hypothetical protein
MIAAGTLIGRPRSTGKLSVDPRPRRDGPGTPPDAGPACRLSPVMAAAADPPADRAEDEQDEAEDQDDDADRPDDCDLGEESDEQEYEPRMIMRTPVQQ